MRFIVSLFIIMMALPAWAGAPLPVPPSVKDVPALNLFIEDTGAELEYVSRQYGVDMWVATKSEIAQVIYTTLDGQGMLMNGFLFAPDGTLVTEQSLSDYASDEGSLVQKQAAEMRAVGDLEKPKTPGEKLWSDLGNAHYVEFGSKSAPVIYTFVDPFCPHCKLFWEGISAAYVAEGKVNLRLIPVGILGQNSANAAAYIVSQSDRPQAWLELVSGNLDNTPLKGEEGIGKITKNYQMMGKWKMQSTPFSVYKDGDGKVKMYNGNPEDMGAFIAGLSARAEKAE